MAGSYLIFSEVRSRSPHGLVVVAIDLTNAGTRHGSVECEFVAKLPKQLTEVHLKLPQSMHSGHYIVAVLQSKSDYKPVALASGIAKGPTSYPPVNIFLEFGWMNMVSRTLPIIIR
jgi:hypothetical protein